MFNLSITPNIAGILPDQTNKIFLAKAVRGICGAVCTVATVSLLYQVYEKPSIMNPFSRSINPWSENSGWFTKDHYTSMVISLSLLAKGRLNIMIHQMERSQTVRKFQIEDLSQI